MSMNISIDFMATNFLLETRKHWQVDAGEHSSLSLSDDTRKSFM